MKAAVLHNFGEIPMYETFPTPEPNTNEIFINVKAVALENVDKMMAENTHFASRQFHPKFPSVIGINGIGALPDGRLASFRGVQAPYGAMAEKVVVRKEQVTPLPEGVAATTAAALLAPALTSLFPLKWGVHMKPGEDILINGATGVSGQLSVQIARLLGAGRIIGTGRNETSLQYIKSLGADSVIDLKQNEKALTTSFRHEVERGLDVIIDYLWGYPTEWLINAITPQQLAFKKQRLRLIQIGEKAGPTLTLSADALRTSGLTILGGTGNLTPDIITEGTEMVLQWIQKDKLQLDTEIVPLQDIAHIWRQSDMQGKKIVIVP